MTSWTREQIITFACFTICKDFESFAVCYRPRTRVSIFIYLSIYFISIVLEMFFAWGKSVNSPKLTVYSFARKIFCFFYFTHHFTFLSRKKKSYLALYFLSTPGFPALQVDLSSRLPQKEINGRGGLQ